MASWISCPEMLRHVTEDLLRPLGLTNQGPEPELAQAVGASGRLQLRASCWRLAQTASEVRMAVIEGESAGIFNCLIVPDHPDRVPVFVADLVVTGGMPRMFFVDLQTPGFDRAIRGQPASRYLGLASRYETWHSTEAPCWALEFSAGRALFARPRERVEDFPLTDIYSDFLLAWSDMAHPTNSLPPTGPESSGELARFKRLHLEESPVSGYLSGVFGVSWAVRFLTDFLYR